MAEDKIKKLDSMFEQVNIIRSCMVDTFQGLMDAFTTPGATINKERLVSVIKTNADLVHNSLRSLESLSSEGGTSWLLPPPGGIGSHTTLGTAIEDPVSIMEHSMQGAVDQDLSTSRWLEDTAARSAFVLVCFEGRGDGISGTKKRRLDYVAQDLISDLDAILAQVTSKEANMKIKTIDDPLLPGMVTAVSFFYTNVFQGQLAFGLQTPNGAVSIERIEIRGVDERAPGRSRHHVFEAIAAQALAAHDHYVRHQPGEVLLRMLLWIASFGRLFAAECAGCKQMLYLDATRSAATDGPVFLPPTLRTYTTLQPYHPQCCKKKDA